MVSKINKSMIISIVLIASSLIYYFEFYKTDLPSKNTKKPIVNKTLKKTKITPLFKIKSSEISINSKTDHDAWEKNSKTKALEFFLPLNTIPTPKDSNGNVTINFSFKKKLVGFRGDLDAIEKVISSSTSKELLISLEPLTGSATSASFRVSFDKLQKGITKVFTLSGEIGKDVPYALFICHDKENKNRCLGKSCADINDINNNIDPDNKDYIFYFQSILIGEKQMRLINGPMCTEQTEKNLSDYLTVLGYEENVAAQVGTKITQLNKEMLSTPVAISDLSLNVVLPYQDVNKRKSFIEAMNIQ